MIEEIIFAWNWMQFWLKIRLEAINWLSHQYTTTDSLIGLFVDFLTVVYSEGGGGDVYYSFIYLFKCEYNTL